MAKRVRFSAKVALLASGLLRALLTESPQVALGELGRGGHHFLSIIAPNDRLYMKFKTH